MPCRGQSRRGYVLVFRTAARVCIRGLGGELRTDSLSVRAQLQQKYVFVFQLATVWRRGLGG